MIVQRSMEKTRKHDRPYFIQDDDCNPGNDKPGGQADDRRDQKPFVQIACIDSCQILMDQRKILRSSGCSISRGPDFTFGFLLCRLGHQNSLIQAFFYWSLATACVSVRNTICSDWISMGPCDLSSCKWPGTGVQTFCVHVPWFAGKPGGDPQDRSHVQPGPPARIDPPVPQRCCASVPGLRLHRQSKADGLRERPLPPAKADAAADEDQRCWPRFH